MAGFSRGFSAFFIILFNVLSVLSRSGNYFYQADSTNHDTSYVNFVLSDDRGAHTNHKRHVEHFPSNDEILQSGETTQSPDTPRTTPAIFPEKSVNTTQSPDTTTTTPVIVPEKSVNTTLSPDTSTTPLILSEKVNYEYYNKSLFNDPKVSYHFWVNLENRTDVNVNELLSNSHRRATTIQLSFDFPFYGYIIKNVTIATGGFVYTGDYVHSWLAATQYIAPLMANFDTNLSNNSFIKYVDNGTAFTIEWGKVIIQNKPDAGEFTFQVTLKNNGDIIFVYKDVPLLVKDINDDAHPVKVGLSDAYILNRILFFVRRKTIHEYHRIDLSKEIRNGTVIYLKALPTCLQNHDCVACLTTKVYSTSKCTWCPVLNKCSSGIDRYRDEWMEQCYEKRIENKTMCSEINRSDNES